MVVGARANGVLAPLPRRIDRLKCLCGETGQVHDTGKYHYVKCPNKSCNRRGPKADFEKAAIDGWETFLKTNPAIGATAK